MANKVKDLEKEIMDKKIRSIYLLYGEEKFDLFRVLTKIEKTFDNLIDGVNFSRFDKTNINNLYMFVTMPSFVGGRKLAIIRNTDLKIDIEFLKDIVLEDVTIIFVEDKVDKRTVNYKLLKEMSYEVEFSYMKENELAIWVASMVKAYNLKISDVDAEHFIKRVGVDKNTIVNELRKIVDYTDKGDSVTSNIIDKVCVKTLQSIIFDLTDAVLEKNTKRALEILDEMIYKREPMQKMLILLYSQFKNLYMVKLYMDENRYNDIATECKIHPFVVSKLSKHAKEYKIKDIEKILKDFMWLDLSSKIGKIDIVVGVKQLICNI